MANLRLSCCSSRYEADLGRLRIRFRPEINNGQYLAVGRPAYRQPPLVLAMLQIGNGQELRIQEDSRGKLEGDAMFPYVGDGFVLVPLELELPFVQLAPVLHDLPQRQRDTTDKEVSIHFHDINLRGAGQVIGVTPFRCFSQWSRIGDASPGVGLERGTPSTLQA